MGEWAVGRCSGWVPSLGLAGATVELDGMLSCSLSLQLCNHNFCFTWEYLCYIYHDEL